MDFIEHLYWENPLKQAEEETGHLSSESKETRALAVTKMLDLQSRKTEEFGLRGDTYYGCPLGEGLDVFYNAGFSLSHVKRLPNDEYHLIMRHLDGMLITVESQRNRRGIQQLGPSMMYYNWVPNHPAAVLPIYMLCHIRASENVHLGELIVRAGFLHKLGYLRDNGVFLNPWRLCPNVELRDTFAVKQNLRTPEGLLEEVGFSRPEVLRSSSSATRYLSSPQ